MDRKTLMYLAGAVGVLIVIVLVATSGGLPRETRALLAAQEKLVADHKRAFTQESAEIESALKKEPRLFRLYRTAWPERLKAAAVKMTEAETFLAAARTLAGENDAKKKGQIEEALFKADAARQAARAIANEIAQTVRQTLALKKNRAKAMQIAEADYKWIQSHNLAEVRTQVSKASADWPAKRGDLAGRLARLEAGASEAEKTWRRLEAENSKTDDAEIDYQALLADTRELKASRLQLEAGENHLRGLTGQLYSSWDKILADMEIREAAEVTFHHKYKIIKLRIVDVKSKQHMKTETQSWVPISKTVYERNKDNLGMTVASKPAGKYDSEASRTTQPAGYSYMCSPSQRSNHYGYWNTSPYGSYWAFYGQYAFMRSMFWGSSYRPIYVNDYRGYSRSYRSGRTYYGRTSSGQRRYGSKSTLARTKYASSRYTRSGGYSKSRYVKSGGKYRGTRYQTRSSSRSSGWGGRRSSGWGGFGGK